MLDQLRILVFAYVYPPDAGSGTYRSLRFTSLWARAGDEVTVLTVRIDHFLPTALVDFALVHQIEPSIEVIRTPAARPLVRLLELRDRLRGRVTPGSPAGVAERDMAATVTADTTRLTRIKDALTGLLTFPDAHVGWILGAVRSGLRAAKARRISCLYATGGPWSALVAATILHKLTRLPLILDFRDPWASSPNLSANSRVSRAAHAWLEAYCVRNASRVIANTDELRRDFTRRYHRLAAERFVSVTNGFDELSCTTPPRQQRFTLVHAGELYLSRNPKHFLQAVARLVQDGSIPRDSMQVRFVGGFVAPDRELASTLDALTGIVEIIPRVPHADAIRMQQDASALVLFQTGLPLQVPRKLYEYLALRRPILAVTDPESATAAILRDVGSHQMATDEVDTIEVALRQLYDHWRHGQVFVPNEERLQAYSNQHLAAKLRQEMLRAACAR